MNLPRKGYGRFQRSWLVFNDGFLVRIVFIELYTPLANNQSLNQQRNIKFQYDDAFLHFDGIDGK